MKKITHKSHYLEMLVEIKDEMAFKIFPDLQFSHVCMDTYLVVGAPTVVSELIKSPCCSQSMECQFPVDPWNIEYKYLGDIEIGSTFFFDLRLKNSEGYRYQIKSNLPKGCQFTNGFLMGASEEISDILDINILAQSNHDEHNITYQIRFFSDYNKAKSFTFNNYLKIGYGDHLVDYDPDLIYYRNFASTEKSLNSPFEEAKIAAKKVFQQANGAPIFLFVSGGIDSQSMTQAFMAAGVPFQAVLMADKGGSNSEDVAYSRAYFNKIKQPLINYEFGYAKFIKNYEYVKMANKYRFNNPEYGILLHLMDAFKGFPVYAGRPISVSHSFTGEQVIGLAVDETWSRSRYLERNHLNGCPEFLIHTPELLESFLQLPMVKTYPKDEPWLYPKKLELLREGGFDVSMAPPIKLTGFEPLEKQFSDTSMGSEMWLHHRGPLKRRYPNSVWRNAIPISNHRIGSLQPRILKTYEDGFSYKYLMKNEISTFH